MTVASHSLPILILLLLEHAKTLMFGESISSEQVCVPCAIDRDGHSISKVATLGSVKTRDLHHVYDGKIKDTATLCTDKMNSYVRFANSNKINLIQLKSGKSKKGIYNIQRINSYHSKLKKFMRVFNGVSTKYLNNYLIWNNWVNVKSGSIRDRVTILLRTSISAHAYIKCKTLSKRPIVPLLG